jgi:uncharacterized protein YndB with AHSA1/START domain
VTVTVQDTVERQLVIPFARQRVWDAITKPEQMSRWFGDKITMELKPGSPMYFQWGEGCPVRGRVEAVEPIDRFAYRWVPYADTDHSIPFEEMGTTLVEFTLEETAEGIRLTVLESGFASLPADLREQTAREHAEGWIVETTHLLDYLMEAQPEQ